jgi:hypothetical protein
MEQQTQTKYKYKKFGETINEKPTQGIYFFCSDWNKEFFGFYAWIDCDNYAEDIEQLQEFINKCNYRDRDTYIELIDYESDCEGLYDYLYSTSQYSHSEVLNADVWALFEDKSDEHFKLFSKHIGSSSLSELESFEYSTYSDKYDLLESTHPDLFEQLEKANALSCFDVEHLFYGDSSVQFEGDEVTIIY